MTSAKKKKNQENSEPVFTNLGKVLFGTGFTKGEVIDYYRKIAPILLPHVNDRAITLKRYPNGSGQPFFFEKHCPSYRPTWVKTASIPSTSREDGHVNHCVVSDERTLLWVANLAALELHVLLSKVADPARPTAMVFDLDPGAPATILDCIRLALEMKDVLQHLGLESFAKTSGGKGLHFYVPLNTPTTFEQTKSFSRAIAELMEKQNPAKVTSTMKKSLRAGKVFIDWSQNDSHKTTVAVYSLRAMNGPSVSTPVTWPELQKALAAGEASKIQFDAPAVLQRVAKKGDLFAPLLTIRQKLPIFPF
ncbi:MAG: non-homologous end-joining DNA ligase [Planctomycetota bacterium]|nr:non-homologous end-joining DNA ligase [Planctomycetota bacterium]